MHVIASRYLPILQANNGSSKTAASLLTEHPILSRAPPKEQPLFAATHSNPAAKAPAAGPMSGRNHRGFNRNVVFIFCESNTGDDFSLHLLPVKRRCCAAVKEKPASLRRSTSAAKRHLRTRQLLQ
jgi:hypothetical protein